MPFFTIMLSFVMTAHTCHRDRGVLSSVSEGRNCSRIFFNAVLRMGLGRKSAPGSSQSVFMSNNK